MGVQESNVELSQRVFAAWNSGDREAALDLFDEGIEVYVSAELLNAGSFRGLDEFMKWIGQWDEAWSSYELSVKESEPLGERHVLSRMRQRAEGALTGIPVEMEVAWLTEVRDGRIAALHLYPAVEEARRVGEEREAKASD